MKEQNDYYFFSIIIPVFNSQDYLERCLDSVCNQSFKDYEIVILNDGSTDKSEEIIKSYAIKYKNIKYFYHRNSGVSITTNRLFELAKGKYIVNIDSDDWVSEELLSNIFNVAKDNYDVIEYSSIYFENGNYYNENPPIICFNTKEGISNFLMKNMYPVLTHTRKAIKRELCLKAQFNGPGYEADTFFMLKIYPFVNSLIHIPFQGYYINVRNNSESLGVVLNTSIIIIILNRIESMLIYYFVEINPIFECGIVIVIRKYLSVILARSFKDFFSKDINTIIKRITKQFKNNKKTLRTINAIDWKDMIGITHPLLYKIFKKIQFRFFGRKS